MLRLPLYRREQFPEEAVVRQMSSDLKSMYPCEMRNWHYTVAVNLLRSGYRTAEEAVQHLRGKYTSEQLTAELLKHGPRTKKGRLVPSEMEFLKFLYGDGPMIAEIERLSAAIDVMERNLDTAKLRLAELKRQASTPA